MALRYSRDVFRYGRLGSGLRRADGAKAAAVLAGRPTREALMGRAAALGREFVITGCCLPQAPTSSVIRGDTDHGSCETDVAIG